MEWLPITVIAVLIAISALYYIVKKSGKRCTKRIFQRER